MDRIVLNIHSRINHREIDFFIWPEDQEEITLGRSSSCDVTLDDEKVSGTHCLLRKKKRGNILIEDQDSQNGTIIGDKFVHHWQVSLPQTFRIGNTMITIREQSEDVIRESFPEGERSNDNTESSGGSDTDHLTRRFIPAFLFMISLAGAGLLGYLFASRFSSKPPDSSNRTVWKQPGKKSTESEVLEERREQEAINPLIGSRREQDQSALPPDPGLTYRVLTKNEFRGKQDQSKSATTEGASESNRTDHNTASVNKQQKKKMYQSSASPNRESSPENTFTSGQDRETESVLGTEQPQEDRDTSGNGEPSESSTSSKQTHDTETEAIKKEFANINLEDRERWNKLQEKAKPYVETNQFERAASVFEEHAGQFRANRYKMMAHRRARIFRRVKSAFQDIQQWINRGGEMIQMQEFAGKEMKPESADRDGYVLKGPDVQMSRTWEQFASSVDQVLRTSQLSSREQLDLAFFIFEKGAEKKGRKALRALFKSDPTLRPVIEGFLSVKRERNIPSDGYVLFKKQLVPKQDQQILEQLPDDVSYPIHVKWKSDNRRMIYAGTKDHVVQFHGDETEGRRPPLTEVRRTSDLPGILSLLLPNSPVRLSGQYEFTMTPDSWRPLVPGSITVRGRLEGMKMIDGKPHCILDQKLMLNTTQAQVKQKKATGSVNVYPEQGTFHVRAFYDPSRHVIYQALTQGSITYSPLPGTSPSKKNTHSISSVWTLEKIEMPTGSARGRTSKLAGKHLKRYKRIQEAMKRGVEYLLKKQGKRPNDTVRTGTGIGFWPTPGSAENNGGSTALVLKSLLSCGVPRTHSAIQKGFNWLKANYYTQPVDNMSWRTVYSASLGLMALESFVRPPEERKRAADFVWGRRSRFQFKQREPPPQIRRYMRNLTRWILLRMNTSSEWSANVRDRHHTFGVVKLVSPPELNQSVLLLDRSKVRLDESRSYPSSSIATQYALLALRSAARSGVQIAPRHWKRILQRWLNQQSSRGPLVQLQVDRFTLDRVDTKAEIRGWQQSVSRTVAGISIVRMAMNSLNELSALSDALRSRGRKSIRDGLAFLQTRYKQLPLHDPPNGPIGTGTEPSGDYWPLFRLQQSMMITVTQTFGGKNWFFDGADELLRDQRNDGGWEENIADTCFALLFLKRSTLPGVPTGRSVGKIIETGKETEDEKE